MLHSACSCLACRHCTISAAIARLHSASAGRLANCCAFPLQGNDERDTTLNQLLSEMDGFGDQGLAPTQLDPII
jgi:hypothetical protein